MSVQPELATVYRAAGRRWLTLDGACRAAARAYVRTATRERGYEAHEYPAERYYRAVTILPKRAKRLALREYLENERGGE